MPASTLNSANRPLARPVSLTLTDRPVRGQDVSVALLTLARLAVVPVVLLCLGHKSVSSVLAVVAFVALDIADGVLARRWTTDGVARRATDSAVDRIAIDASLVTALAIGLLPWPVIAAFLLRDAYCIDLCRRMYRASGGSVIKAGWTHRTLNLAMAAGGIVAPWLSSEARIWAALLVLAYAVVVAIDLRRMTANVRIAYDQGAPGRRVVSTRDARQPIGR